MEIVAIYLGGLLALLLSGHGVFAVFLYAVYRATGGKMKFRRWYKEMHF